MPRSATTSDAFNAVAEPRRREILDLLAHGERSVSDMVHALRLAQPQVSKHLHVLRQVDLVRVRELGRQRLYRINGERLKPIHDWTGTFERFWDRQLDRIKRRAESNFAMEKKSKSQTSKKGSDSHDDNDLINT